MAYQFEPEETLSEAMRRIAAESLEECLTMIDHPEVDDAETVHEIRKHCKKLRALIRLVDPYPEGALKHEFDRYREIALSLSRVREAHVLIPALDEVIAGNQDSLSETELGQIRTALWERRRKIETEHGGMPQILLTTRAALVDGHLSLGAWSFPGESNDKICEGLLRAHELGTAAAKKARKRPDEKRFHDWRKRAKTHWYHTRLLGALYSGELAAYPDQLYQLTDQLGRERDLFTLLDELRRGPAIYQDSNVVLRLEAAIAMARDNLRQLAFDSGECMHEWDPAPVLSTLSGTASGIPRVMPQANGQISV